MGYQACQKVVKLGNWISYTEAGPHRAVGTYGPIATKSETICSDTFETRGEALTSLQNKLTNISSNCGE